MKISDVMELYRKEREYETCIFGDYKNVESLNFASFLIFLKEYCDKALTAYSGKWNSNLPPWLKNSKEFEVIGTAPVKAYEEVIKIMALAGAILETYTDIDPEKWREDLEAHMSKWRKD
jgi:hypothetical protein